MDNTSYIEISESALANNLEYIRSRLKPGCELSHVVKGNAYGHGIGTFAPLAYKQGARHFSVFDAHEAHQVLKSLPAPATIMIMGMIENSQLEWAVENEIEFFVFETGRLKASIEAAKKLGKPARIHLELETGMNRTGFENEKWNTVADLCVKNRQHLQIKGFCTHYAGAEHLANHIRIKRQIKNFNKGVEVFKRTGIEAEKLHTACSAAFVRLPHTHHNLVRVGIMQYGFWPSTETYIATAGAKENSHDPLQRVISWKSRIMNTKPVQKGEYIGYGTSYLASSNMIVASVPVGYAHGFSRTLSNVGRALVRGCRVPVVGIVNMNVMMLDISDLDHVEPGDEVVLIGTQGDQTISVSSFGDYSDQLNYELLTRLPHDIPRFVVN